MNRKSPAIAAVLVAIAAGVGQAEQLGSGFSFQGQLTQDGQPTSGIVTLEFSLWDAATLGSQIGSAVVINDVPVADGLFTVQLNQGGEFGPSAFSGAARWLAIIVNGTPLTPRQPVTAAPYALYALNGPSGWHMAGNSGTNAETDFLGTSDNVALNFRVNNERAMRLEPASNASNAGPNVIGGHAGNSAGAGVVGATIFGGGNFSGWDFPNRVNGDFGSVIGGNRNRADGMMSFVSGGTLNNASGTASFVGGGSANTASGYSAFVAGGDSNTASGDNAFVSGGRHSTADGNDSFAAGTRAKANHNGTFVWADSAWADFPTTAANQFLIRSGGGVGINTNAPTAALDVNGTAKATGLMVNGPATLTSFQLGTSTTAGHVLTANAAGIGTWQAPPADNWTLAGSNLYNNNAGNIGLGTNAPAHKLAVVGNALVQGTQGYDAGGETARIYLGDMNASIRAVYGFGLRLSAFNAQDGLILEESTGRVGIGTTSPQAKVHAEGGSADGGRFTTSAAGGAGVYGLATHASGANYGVIGASTSGAGYGVYSLGRFASSGTKSFQIDHPLDPENKKLNHYCAEGPEPMNIYSGNVVTDSQGIAWVTLPDYFESINRDYRYALTIVDDGESGTTRQFALAKVAQKIRGNRFSIRTSEPNVEVSWEVKAVRNDRFVQCIGAPVEVEKSAAERGKYLAPALFGQPAEKGIFYHGVADVRGTGSNEILTRSAASDVARDPAVAPARQ